MNGNTPRKHLSGGDPRLGRKGQIRTVGLSQRESYSAFLANVSFKADEYLVGPVERSTVLVTNLPMSTTKEQLEARFSKFGPIRRVELPKCDLTYSNFGIACITFGDGRLRNPLSARAAVAAAGSRAPIVIDGATLEVYLDARGALLKEQLERQKARALAHLSNLLKRPKCNPTGRPQPESPPPKLWFAAKDEPATSPKLRVDSLRRLANVRSSASPRTPVKAFRDDHLQSPLNPKRPRHDIEPASEGRIDYASPRNARRNREIGRKPSPPMMAKPLHWPEDPFPFPDFKPPSHVSSHASSHASSHVGAPGPPVDYCVTVESRYLPLFIADEAAMLDHFRQFGAREVSKEQRCWVIIFDSKALAERCLRNPAAQKYQGYHMVGKLQVLADFRNPPADPQPPPEPSSPMLLHRTLPATGLPSFKRYTSLVRPAPQPTLSSPPASQPPPQGFTSRTPSPRPSHRPPSPGSLRRPFEPVTSSPPEPAINGSPPPNATGCARTQGYYPTLSLKPFRQPHAPGGTGIRDGAQPSRCEPISGAAKDRIRRQEQGGRRVVLARSNIHDWGLFAREPIKKGELVIEYVGELIRSDLADVREYRCFARGIDASYLFRIDEDYVVDATDAGNIARFINHSCQPNCKARITRVAGQSRIFIYADEDIERHQEITYDYQFPIEDEDSKIKCLCNTPACRGFLN
ncbi:histone methyltransferase set1 [Massospora cicadina]|nr:histone methyltransferase set1 [Massospora cicadina]